MTKSRNLTKSAEKSGNHEENINLEITEKSGKKSGACLKSRHLRNLVRKVRPVAYPSV